MAAPTVLGIDTGAVQQQVYNSQMSGSGDAFDSILATSQYAAGVFSPVAAAYGDTQSGAIVSAAVNAAAGASYLSGGTYGSYSSSLGSAGATNYLTGGAAYSTTGSDSTDMAANMESIMNESYMNQSMLIAFQSEMGSLQTQTTSVSNALNVKHSAMRSVINNFRVA